MADFKIAVWAVELARTLVGKKGHVELSYEDKYFPREDDDAETCGCPPYKAFFIGQTNKPVTLEQIVEAFQALAKHLETTYEDLGCCTCSGFNFIEHLNRVEIEWEH